MSFVKNLRAKILLSSLIPGTIALVAVTLIALFTYEAVARNIVQQRDTELAKISAARLSEGLTRHIGVLQTAADDDDIQSLGQARIGRALERVQIELFAFDAGVVIYNDQGVAVGSDPFAFKRRGEDFPVRSEFDKVRTTRRPSFSNVFEDTISGEKVILVTVPIVASGNEFKGVLAGMSTLKSLVSDVTYSEVLEITAGREGFAYLVDGQGKTIYHRDASLLGESLLVIDPVARAARGETGAVIADDLTGENVISGFAPVPDTGFSVESAVITQDRWGDVVGPIRRAGRLMLGLFVLGAVLASALVFFSIGRVLRPVKALTEGARRISAGDFEHPIEARTGDEIQALAQQFNTMAGALKESYADLELKIASRTRELRDSEERLRTVVTGAPVVMFALDRKGVFTLSEGKGLDALSLTAREVVGKSAFELYRDEPQIVENVKRTLAGEAVTSTMQVDGLTFETRYSPLRSESGEVDGLIGVATDVTERRRAEEALRQSEERYRALFEQSRDPIFISEDGRVQDINQAALGLFGFTREEAMGLEIAEVYVEPLDQIRLQDELETHGSVKDFEARFRKRDGVEIDCLITASVRLGEDGSRRGTQGVIRDITEHKKLEATQLEQTRDLAVLGERNRMAREIHDTMAQGFTGIVLQMEAGEQAFDESPTEVKGHLEKAKNLARECLQEARRSVWNLLPKLLEQRPLDAALEEAVQQFGAEGQETARFELSGERRELPVG